MSGPVSFTGLSSGIDTQAIVEQLMAIERRPLNILELRQAETQLRLEYYQDLHSRLSALDSSVNTLNLTSTVSAKAATSSNSNVLGATAGSAASVGNFVINSITQLAKASSEASAGVQDSTAAFVSGTYFNFTVGTEDFNITLEEGQKTLEGLRDAINAEADGYATAAIINTGDADDPYKLVITSDETGEENAISGIDTDVRVTTSGGEADLTFAASVTAQDAVFSVNGVSVTRSSNTISDVIEGVTLELKDEAASAVTVTVSRDTEALKSALEGFIENYNEANSLIQSQFTLDPESGEAGFLSGDFTLRQVQQTLQQNVVSGVEDADGNRYSLATVGIEIDKYTGALSLNETTFNDAVENEDKDLFLDLFLARGTPSDSRVSYVRSGHETVAGTYAINVSGYDGDGNVQGTFTKDGDVITGVGEGQYLLGPDGSDADGLRIRIASGETGDLGSLYFSVGVAETMERRLDDYLTPLVGFMDKTESRLEEDILDLDDQIAAFEERLALRQQSLLQQFLAAEQAISTLQGQTSAFQQQLNTIGGGSLL